MSRFDRHGRELQQGSRHERSGSTQRNNSEYRAYRDGQRSTYDQYRGSNQARSYDQRYPQQETYSRYESGARYAEAAQRRSNPYVGQEANAYNQGHRKKRGSGMPQVRERGFGPRRSHFGLLPKIALGVLLAAVVFFGVRAWLHRPVEITVNGKTQTIAARSTIPEIYKAASITTKAGNFISITGKTLEKNEGYQYLVKLDGEELDGAATDAYRAHEGDSLTFENGRDKTEDYTTDIGEKLPELEFAGDSWGNITYVSQWGKAGKAERKVGSVSGEVAYGNTIEEAQNCIVSVHQIVPDGNKKLVALTFDDGPAEGYTEKYLEILNTYGIKATFFNLGQQVEAYPELAKKIVEQGSEIMSHTYQHQQLSTLDAASLQSEFSNAFEDIDTNVGVSTTSFRPPYGDFNQNCWLNSGGLASVSVLWNMDSEDWRRAGVDSLVENSTSGIFSGAIILMHDGGGERSQDVEALPKIIEKLQSQGYEFVTVSELMKSDSSIPADIASGNATMPEDCVWPITIAGQSDSSD